MQPPDGQATEQLELAISRRRWRGRVLAWLALAVWLAALIGARAAWRRQDDSQALLLPDLAQPLDVPLLGYALLAAGGLLGAALAAVGVKQARRDVLAWVVLALNLLTALGGLASLLAVRFLGRP